MFLRTKYQYVKPGFDFNRWLLALRRRWSLFIASVVFGVVLFSFLYSITPKRYNLSSAFFVSKDVDTDLFGAELRIPLLRIFAKQNNIENHIGVLKSNQMLYECLLDQERYISYNNIDNSENSPIKVSFPDGIMPIGLSMSISNVTENSCLLRIKGGEKQLMTLASGYMNSSILLRHFEQVVPLNEAVNFDHFNLMVHKCEELPVSFTQEVTTHNLRKLMGSYDQKTRIKTLNKRATILTIGISTETPEIDAELINLLMHKTIEERKAQEKRLALHILVGLKQEYRKTLKILNDLSKERADIKKNKDTAFLTSSVRSILTELNEIDQSKDKINLEIATVNKCIEELTLYNTAIFSSLDVSSDPSVIKSVKSYHNLLTQLDSVSVINGMNNPTTIRLKSKVDFHKRHVLEKFVNRNVQLSLRMNVIELRELALNNMLNELPYLERTLGELDRNIAYNEKVAKKLKKKIAEVAMASNYESTVFNVLEEAQAKKIPFAPLNAEGLLVTILIALFFPVTLVFADSYLGSRIYSAQQIEQLIRDKPLVRLHRFTFSKKRPFLFVNDGKQINEEFKLFIKEIQFSVDQLMDTKKGVVLGFYRLYNRKCGLGITANISAAMKSLGIRNIQITIEHDQGVLPADDCKELLSAFIGNKLVLNSMWLDEVKMLEELLNLVRLKYPYTLISLSQKLSDERRIVFSQFTDLNLGLVKEHFSREHNLSSFKEVFERLSNVPVKMIYLSGYFRKFHIVKPIQSHYDCKTNILDKIVHYFPKSWSQLILIFKSIRLHMSRK